jgi:hypothetical protein
MSEQMLENGLLYGLKTPSSYTSLEEKSIKTINEGLAKFPKAAKMFGMLQADTQVNTLLHRSAEARVQRPRANSCEDRRSERRQDTEDHHGQR